MQLRIISRNSWALRCTHAAWQLPRHDGPYRTAPPSSMIWTSSPFHSITSSARASSVDQFGEAKHLGGLELMTISNFVGCSRGGSTGFSPLRMRFQMRAASRCRLRCRRRMTSRRRRRRPRDVDQVCGGADADFDDELADEEFVEDPVARSEPHHSRSHLRHRSFDLRRSGTRRYNHVHGKLHARMPLIPKAVENGLSGDRDCDAREARCDILSRLPGASRQRSSPSREPGELPPGRAGLAPNHPPSIGPTE